MLYISSAKQVRAALAWQDSDSSRAALPSVLYKFIPKWELSSSQGMVKISSYVCVCAHTQYKSRKEKLHAAQVDRTVGSDLKQRGVQAGTERLFTGIVVHNSAPPYLRNSQ